MLLGSRHRHAPYAFDEGRSRPRLVARIIVACIALVIIWYLGRTVFALFRSSSVQRTGVTLLLEQPSGNDVEVSLQSGQMQRAEDHLKLYTGDRIITHPGAHAVVSFFDGTQIRLDEDTNVTIDETDRVTNGPSTIAVNVARGRVWAAVPPTATYSGAIVRTVTAADVSAELPAETSGLFSKNLIVVMRAKGLGVTVHLDAPKRGAMSVIIGEGQVLSLSEEKRALIAAGGDPYDVRDPISVTYTQDSFIAKSYASARDVIAAVSAQGGFGGGPASGTTDLTVTQPDNMALVDGKTVTVSGRVSSAVHGVTINSYDATVKSDGSFSQDLSVGSEDTMTIQIEAQDEQGIVVADAQRTVRIGQKRVAPVTITAPVGSGGTFDAAHPLVEIEGKAPAGTAGIVVNDYHLQLFKPGNRTWTYLANANLGNLLFGPNIFSVYAVDADGNRSAPATITIVYQGSGGLGGTGASTNSASSSVSLSNNPPLTPGVLSVTAPVAGTSAEVADEETLIEGKTSAETDAVWVNDYKLSLYLPGKTTWNYIASTEYKTLKEGQNVYRIVARNKNGEVLDKFEYTMTYKP